MRLQFGELIAVGWAPVMAGPHDGVPAAQPLPKAPNVLLLAATTTGAVLTTVGGLTVLWPSDGSLPSQTYWMLVAVLTAAGGVLLALRLLVHERKREQVLLWNSCREQWLGQRVRAWQQPAKVVALAYSTAAGNRCLAQALRAKGPVLQPVYVDALGACVTFSALRGYVPTLCLQAYRRRLAQELGAVLAPLAPAMEHLAGHRLAVRVRHDRQLADAEIEQLLVRLLPPQARATAPVFAHHEDGFLWLGPWLDAHAPAPWLLCIDFNLFLMPHAGQAEGVSAVLLAHPSVGCEGLAALHRPISSQAAADCLAQACAASEASPSSAWLACRGQAHSTSIALANVGIAASQQHALDLQLGHGGTAMAALLLITACEQAHAQEQAQLLLFTDRTLQACVVRPCGKEAQA
ncbi:MULTISPECIES: hypothetical protein [unclassified Pseudomonas]|uniref:hypothetical protein n=1 Tax=unclassified Pseudomonas TaxID=196821 RepID=UPI000BD206D4|nr:MULTISPECIES: hypothetical protein [unclassified Pseudomonas]PVZ19632.1 hypothetical protein F474_00221 [Pseudomonas sp. URIL14HWK12:I12]PVZ22783.1 hypothetical protein F470_03279 [Pseudomonas sp. URIL14HWK12:I10]PVZ37587.1 hypothetical protein F472_00221 [Pseudomonas sp. URIL14HWK12:I11]SNZ15190.1 hypothetical protein SAMN05660463_03015 [Pseudomonas sp. URIL14HWK12:I9]